MRERGVRWLRAGAGLASGILAVTGATPASAATTENWTANSPYFHTTHGSTGLVSNSGTKDGKALRLTLPADPGAGPGTARPTAAVSAYVDTTYVP